MLIYTRSPEPARCFQAIEVVIGHGAVITGSIHSVVNRGDVRVGAAAVRALRYCRAAVHDLQLPRMLRDGIRVNLSRLFVDQSSKMNKKTVRFSVLIQHIDLYTQQSIYSCVVPIFFPSYPTKKLFTINRNLVTSHQFIIN